jgi:hypothetical protein
MILVPDTFITKTTIESKEPLPSSVLIPYSNDTSTPLDDVYKNTDRSTPTTSIDDTKIHNDDRLATTDDILATSSCIWKTNEFQNCLDLLINHISLSLSKTRMEFLQSQQRTKSHNNSNLHTYFQNRSTIIHRRWLFLGDSTIFRLFFVDTNI